MILHYIKQWLPLLFLGLWIALPARAQDISSLSPSTLPFGAYVTGLYNIEADDGSGLYLEEQTGGALAEATLNATASGFYFWLVENVYENYFQLYSATQQEQLLKINQDGSVQWTTDPTEAASKLFFRMYTTGLQRTAADAAMGITAIGHITTVALTANYGNADCRCNFLSVDANARFRLHDSGIQSSNYRPVVFEKTDDANTLGSVTIDHQNNKTQIVQNPSVIDTISRHNFVSSNFFVGGFGEDDFEITVASGTEGDIGFLEYTDHHYTKEVYKSARPKIGLKIANDMISLIYLSGDQSLPGGSLDGETPAVNLVTGMPFTLGFKDQDSLIVSQNGNRYGLARTAPAELFFNRSVTQSARMLVRLLKGTVDIAYTTKNHLINSEDDLGTNNGSELVSTNAYLPYNEGDTFVNTFDWQQTQWPVRYVGEGGTVTDTVFSPFYSNSTKLSGITAKSDLPGNYTGGEDFASTEGWELIKADLGYNADGTTHPQAPIHPYIILYDRVGATLRVFVYTNNQGEANQLNVSLVALDGLPIPPPPSENISDGYAPKLWGSLQQFTSLDQVAQSEYSRALPFYSGSGRSWYFSDFVMEYDPCIAFFESTINLRVYKTTQGSLTMVGRFEGGSLPVGTPEYSDWQNQRDNFLLGVMDNNFGSLANTLGDITFNQYDQFNLLKFRDSVSGSLVGKQIADWEKEKARLEWEASQTIGEATIAEGSAKVAEGVAKIGDGIASGFGPAGASVAGGFKVAAALATIAGGAAKIIAGEAKLDLAYAKKLYYDNIKDKVKQGDQQITMAVPPPRPQAVFGELALKGTLSINTTLIPETFIATPGGLNSDNAPEWYSNGSRGAAPLYSRPMGKFTLLKQPQFGLGIAYSENAGYKAYLKIGKKPCFAHNNTVMGKIDDMLTISINVQTLNSQGAVVHTATGKGYTNLFGIANSNALPGAMEVSGLINWNQIHANIAGLTNPTAQDIENALSSWIKVSYDVWSLTLTSLKSRNLSRVFANGNHYYKGVSSFAYTSGTAYSANQLRQEAITLVETEFANYDFSDDVTFGNNYTFYHSQYNEEGDDFYTIMNNYCKALKTAQNPGGKNAEADEEVKGKENTQAPVLEEVAALEPGLTVYPNPARYEVNFRLVSEASGRAKTTLYDLTGKALISTTDILNGRDMLQGRINIAPLPAGIYILEVRLPGGKAITKKIVKQ